MIEFHYETDFRVEDETKFADWLSRVIVSEDGETGQLDYIFCSDNYLFKLNKKHLNHDTLTDIITFDYSEGGLVAGDIFISVDRVRENAVAFKTNFEKELLRVMAHGVLHLLKYNDKTKEQQRQMSAKEDEKMKLFHVEQ